MGILPLYMPLLRAPLGKFVSYVCGNCSLGCAVIPGSSWPTLQKPSATYPSAIEWSAYPAVR